MAAMAAREHQETHYVDQTRKMVPLVTRENLFGWHVSKFVFGVNILDLDLWFQVDSVEQPIIRNSVGSGHVSRRWTSTFDDHLDHSLSLQKCTTETRLEKNVCWWVRNPQLKIAQPLAFSFQLVLCSWVFLMEWSPVPHKSPWVGPPCLAVLFVERNTSITMPRRSRARNLSMRNPASNEMISDSVELWDTEVCFLHIQLMETNVRLTKIQKTYTEVDFECSRSPAKSEPWNKPNLQCCAVFPS